MLARFRLTDKVKLLQRVAFELHKARTQIKPAHPPGNNHPKRPIRLASSAKSVVIRSRTNGRCTFTAAGVPSRSTARWTCTTEAEASGVS